jgi:choline transport protein
VNSLILVTTIVGLLQLINIGSTTALYAILSLSTLALYISYVIPIIFFTLARFRGDHIPYGPFRLGRWGMPLNLFSIVYGIFIIIWLPFPPYMPVTSLNMNYGGPVVGAVIIFALIDWFIWGKKRFSVPVDKVGVYE